MSRGELQLAASTLSGSHSPKPLPWGPFMPIKHEPNPEVTRAHSAPA